MSSYRSNGRTRYDGGSGVSRGNRNTAQVGGNFNNKVVKDYSNEWLHALENATACLLNSHATMEDLDRSLKFLNQLEALLLVKERKWHRPPNEFPPVWNSNGPLQLSQSNNTNQNYSGTNANLGGGIPFMNHPLPADNNDKRSTNRYASFQDSDDSDDDSDKEDSDGIDDDEAGDHVTFHTGDTGTTPADDTAPRTEKTPYVEGMDMRRIMIRLLNAQSDIFAAQAYIYRKQLPPAWSLGATQYTHCVHKIHGALMLADSEISKWLSASYSAVLSDRVLQLLTVDADIVEVSVHSMVTNRDEFIAFARQQESKLLQHLQPQWQSRDEVKNKMGKQRWFTNPNPKHDYSVLRTEYESQLREIRTALNCLDELDTSIIIESTKQLREKLQHNKGSNGGSSLSTTQPYVPRTSQPVQQDNVSDSQRYNGSRPTDLSRRVDMHLYPDPTNFGWMFTGSSGVTEFFEKDVVKLDWYFTTATIKTSMDHPTQGRTQLFASRVDPETYRAILENPRTHTGKRYQRKGKPRRN